ncbi:ankyrin repeat domain-containing protein [Endozoicomonas numazuensis]|uniref:Uncharacterized protein n=1 Tax=Endozoicomonas numazuensis TaxID=1137799 RepID=A0A081N187_9GAMM|nr:ankyrin repeat domain-containing protein [Endozoicomonas numazuensis]KEQ12210.1 hypothetical protein GZ78_27630 [Endozoicomonas numazuensis]
MKKAILLVTLTPILIFGFIFTYISSLSINERIICSVDNNAFIIPKPLCKLYLYNFTSKNDAKELDETYGLSYLFGTEDEFERYEILDIFIRSGADIDKPSNVDGLTPINAAILFSDYKLVGYLIASGANLNIKDIQNNMNAFEYVIFLMEKDSGRDREEIMKLISEYRLKES